MDSVNGATVAPVDSGDAAVYETAVLDRVDPVEEPVDWVSPTPIIEVAAVYSAIYACHWLVQQRFLPLRLLIVQKSIQQKLISIWRMLSQSIQW